MLPVREFIDDLPLDPIERAQICDRLIEQARTAQERFAAARREAIYTATRLMSYGAVATELDVSEAAINKAVSEHRRR